MQQTQLIKNTFFSFAVNQIASGDLRGPCSQSGECKWLLLPIKKQVNYIE